MNAPDVDRLKRDSLFLVVIGCVSILITPILVWLKGGVANETDWMPLAFLVGLGAIQIGRGVFGLRRARRQSTLG